MPEEFTQDEFLVMELACGKLTNSITSQDEFEIKYANLAALNLFQVFRVGIRTYVPSCRVHAGTFLL